MGKKYDRYKGLEANLQKAVALLLDSYGFIWFHPPNEIKAKPQYLKKRAAMGVKSGVPDCMILTPNNNYTGLAIELKANYNKPTPEQLAWLSKLESIGYYTLISYSLDEVIDIVEAYAKDRL